MELAVPPLFEALAGARSILVAGAGGGFDVYTGLPLALALRAQGRIVHLGNLSFASLEVLDLDTWLAPGVAVVTARSRSWPASNSSGPGSPRGSRAATRTDAPGYRAAMEFDGADGRDLMATAAGELAAREPDLHLLEAACTALAGRIDRGDMMIGILPTGAAAVVVAGLSTVATATAWSTLGRCYLGVDGALLPPVASLPGHAQGSPLDRARACFAQAAALGDRDGALLFARACADGPPDAQRAAREHLRPHAATDPEARYRLGLVEQWLGDPSAAVPHHEWAAARGNADAAFELYVLHSTGAGVPLDEDTGRTWLLRAADLGQHRALYNLGAAHATGSGFPADLTVAAAYYRRAAEAGNPRAAATLGYLYLTGGGVPEDETTAARWFDIADALGYPVDEWLDQLGLDRPQPQGA